MSVFSVSFRDLLTATRVSLTCLSFLTCTCLSCFAVTVQEEQEYVELVAAEKHQQEALKSALAQNKTLSMLDEILEDVRKAADRLEEEIEEHAFDNNKQVAHTTCIHLFFHESILPGLTFMLVV